MKRILTRKNLILLLAIVLCLGSICIVVSSNGEIPAESIFAERVQVNGNTVKSELDVWDIEKIQDNIVVGTNGKETQPLFFKETGSVALVETVVTRLDDSTTEYRQNEPMAGIYVTDGTNSGYIGVRANSIYYTNNTWKNGVIGYDVLSRLAQKSGRTIHTKAAIDIALKDNKFYVYVDYIPVGTVDLSDVVPGIEEGADVAIGLLMHAGDKNAKLQYKDVTFTTDVAKAEDYIARVVKQPEIFNYYTTDARALGKGYTAGMGSEKITVGENTTVFIGDSFFDSRFYWKKFYTDDLKDADAFCAGISGSRAWEWRYMLDDVFEVFGDKAPKNIAIHLGTNHFAATEAADVAVGALKDYVFLPLHEAYPDAKIYYFGITHREDIAVEDRINEANRLLSEWCSEEGQDYITYIDTPSLIKTEDLLSDKLHPAEETYAIFVEELLKAGCEILDKNGGLYTYNRE